jgi:hypothetical protein
LTININVNSNFDSILNEKNNNKNYFILNGEVNLFEIKEDINNFSEKVKKILIN